MFVYGLLRVLTLDIASTHRTENPRGFSEVGENKQLLIAIVPVAQLKYIYKFLYLAVCKDEKISPHNYFTN